MEPWQHGRRKVENMRIERIFIRIPPCIWLGRKDMLLPSYVTENDIPILQETKWRASPLQCSLRLCLQNRSKIILCYQPPLRVGITKMGNGLIPSTSIAT